MGVVLVRKRPVVMEIQIHSEELPFVCFGGSVWKGSIYSQTGKNSQKQTNVIISDTQYWFSAMIVVCT